jgi:hypothetical protein
MGRRVTCNECDFWAEYTSFQGQCRRHPPVVIGDSYGRAEHTSWPETSNDDWCGKATVKLRTDQRPWQGTATTIAEERDDTCDE